MITKLLEEDDDYTKPTDEIRRNDMKLYEYTYLMISIVKKTESLSRYVIVENFCDHQLSEADHERIKELEHQAKLKKQRKMNALQAAGATEADLEVTNTAIN